MADPSSLENLSGPVPVPPPLGEAPVDTTISTGRFDSKTQDVTNALVKGGAEVIPPIGTGNETQVIPTDTVSSGDIAGPGEAFVPDQTTLAQDFAVGGKKALRQQRRADRQARGGAFAAGRKEDKDARMDAWRTSKR
jgi:hypothetical protein